MKESCFKGCFCSKEVNKVILNLIQDPQRLFLLINSVRGRSRIKYGMTSLCNNGAFTLIELLVVVLIIGILAAVAVPQYQKAVYKSRAAEAVTMIKAITEAEEVYYLANNEYTADISQLDVNVPTELIQESFAIPLFENKYSYTCARKTECLANSQNNNLPQFQFNFRKIDDVDAGKFYCALGSGDDKTDIAKSICQSMGYMDESRTQSWAVGKYFIIN